MKNNANNSGFAIISDIATYKTAKGAEMVAFKSDLKDKVIFTFAKSQKMFLMRPAKDANLPGYYTLTGSQSKIESFITALNENAGTLKQLNSEIAEKPANKPVNITDLRKLAGLK
jgi:hypothetical protein